LLLKVYFIYTTIHNTYSLQYICYITIMIQYNTSTINLNEEAK